MLQKDLREIVRFAEELGFDVRHVNNRLKLYHDGTLVFSVPGNPGQDGRWTKNVKAELRRRAKVVGVQGHDQLR